MSGNLDFSSLSDDQLIVLIKQACNEAARRGTATNAAARNAVLTEAEKSQIANAAMEKELARQRAIEAERVAQEAANTIRRQFEQDKIKAEQQKVVQLWETKESISKRVQELLNPDENITFHVWSNSSKTDVRV